MLKWNQHEFIECLEVLPEIEEDGTSHLFRVAKDGLRLELAVFQYEADICVEIYKEGLESPLFHAQIMSCPSARYLAEKNGRECLEFEGLFGYTIGDEDRSLVPVVVRVTVNPQIRVELSLA
ncbi:hypothetical protein ACQ4M4_15560 [Leptolyngbya sp. AN02str]|uniref:hypothetical protein n=1 Tax=Leptolyngbya sp. AN02str TaxID=3423363 RepID=UPI003D324139